jgi:phosphate transport system substrate-binding protein
MQDDDRGSTERGQATAQPLTQAVPLLWALVALAIATLTAAAAVILLRAARGPRPAFLDAPGRMAAPPAAAPRGPTEALVLAGSGSSLPLTRALAEAFRKRSPGAKIVVPESIGSTGGIRAVRDGAVDVGLISRALSEEEARLGLTVTPYARVAVVVAAHPSVPDGCTASGDLVGLYAGTRAHWSDGSRVVVLQRERGDSSFLAFSQVVSGLAAQNDAGYHENRWRVLYDDRAMQEALMATEGAVGIFDLGAIVAQRLPIKVLCVDGVVPSPESVLAGRYRFSKDLAFVTAGPLVGVRAELLRFALEADGRALIAAMGYVPLPLGPAASPRGSAEGGTRASTGGGLEGAERPASPRGSAGGGAAP